MNISAFFDDQLKNWDLARQNFSKLQSRDCKTLVFTGFSTLVQFNSERIRSTNAHVDKKSIESRACFLCGKNRPPEQKTLEFPPNYAILVNPYPIFDRHLTIPDIEHRDQKIEGRIDDMLDLAKELQDFTVLYNGPKSGASAPDHFHFQAVPKGLLPFEKDLKVFGGKTLISGSENGNIWYLRDYLRKVFVFESKNIDFIKAKFAVLYDQLAKFFPDAVEPGLNITAWFEGETCCLSVFPRSKHRPCQFFVEGAEKTLISPGAVDMAGVIITARKEDFDKVNESLISDIFSQVSINEEQEKIIYEKLK